MADIEGGGGGGHKKGKKVRGKKMSTRVDFTPMVDLGFLLITFFMLTTTMNKPQTMEITMPVKDKTIEEKDQSKIKESQAMTILLADNDRIVYYFGITDPQPQVTGFSKNGIRKVLIEENRKRNANVDSIAIYKKMFVDKQIKEDEYKKRVSDIKAFKAGLIVLIKADDKAKYKNLVDILDEMNICNIGRYAIVDITPVEEDMIKAIPN